MQFNRESLIRHFLNAEQSIMEGAKEPDEQTTHVLSALFWMASASSEAVPKNRENIYRVCHAIAKQYDIYPEMRMFMRYQWKAKSMRELSDQAVRVLYHFMRTLERHISERAK